MRKRPSVEESKSNSNDSLGEEVSWTTEMVQELKALAERGPVKVRIVSGSMEPVLSVGETYEVIHKDFSDLRRFDIVIFLAESRLIAHYVWHVNRVVDSDRLTTRSLTPGLEDLPVTSTEIIGCIQSAEIPLWTRLRLALFGRD